MGRLSKVEQLASAVFWCWIYENGGVEKNPYPIILLQSGRFDELTTFFLDQKRLIQERKQVLDKEE